MSQRVQRWPRVRSLGALLQTPAHRVVRVLHVTRSHWVDGDRRGVAAAAGAPRPVLPVRAAA